MNGKEAMAKLMLSGREIDTSYFKMHSNASISAENVERTGTHSQTHVSKNPLQDDV